MFERVDMRFLFWLLAIVSVFWSGYWFVGSRSVEKAAVLALEEAALSGYDVAYSSLNTTGFPSRFDTTIKDIDILTLAGLRWKASFIQLFALSYKPNHIIAVWPHEQVLEYQGNQAVISSEDLRASLVVKPRTTLELDRFQMTGDAVQIVVNQTQTYRAKAISAASRQGALPFSHDVSVTVLELLTPSPRNPSQSLSFDRLALDANLEFDAPIGRSEIPANLTALTLNSLALSQGTVDLTLTGTLTFDTQGYATGALTLAAQNWQEGFAMIQDAVAIPEDQAKTITTLLKGLAFSNGSATDIQAPLTVKRGKIYMGFIPLGSIPPL